MKEGVHIGKVDGVRIGANWSLVPIFVVVVWGLAMAQLPHGAGGNAVVS
jgi:hypothetical protein